MKTFKEFFDDRNGDWDSSDTLLIEFSNQPSGDALKLLTENRLLLTEGQWKDHKKGYQYRYDKRPKNQGGDQIHIKRRNESWAYRHNGTKSEPGKYKLQATNAVKELVADIFGLQSDQIEEAIVRKATNDHVLLEITWR
jgi:hypothetical protein